jgi:DNA ligase (NAD+)
MKNFGASRVAALCVDSIPELYTRSINDFLKVPRFGKSMATALYNGIREKIVNIPPERFICALGVTGLGERASTKLFTQITIDELLSASTFADISDQVKLNSNIQESLGKSLRYIQDITNELRAYGLTFEQTDDEEVAVKDSNLFGKLFVISGKPEAPWKSKADVEESIIAAGGKVSSTLTKKADYLVSSAESTSAKTEKAKEWGIEILTFAQLADMLGIRSTE